MNTSLKNKPKGDHLSTDYIRIMCDTDFYKIIKDIYTYSSRMEIFRHNICFKLLGKINKRGWDEDYQMYVHRANNGFYDTYGYDRNMANNGFYDTYGYDRRSRRIVRTNDDTRARKVQPFNFNELKKGYLNGEKLKDSPKNLKRISKNIGYNFIGISKDGNYITYIPYNKKYKTDWVLGNEKMFSQHKRQKVKIGKFIKSVFSVESGYELTNQEIEKFVSFFKSFSNKGEKFEEKKGEDIKKTFISKNLLCSSSLGNSCMNNKPSVQFNLYSDNPKNISMLVLKSSNGLIKGRALLWKLDDGRTYMDRIYYYNEYIRDKFEKYGRKKGYLLHVDRNVYESSDLKVTLENFEYYRYPYLDTFQFFSILTGVFTNSVTELQKQFNLPTKFFKKLHMKIFKRKKYKKLKKYKNESHIRQARVTSGIVNIIN